ncbi:MAG: hypothetical protein QF718_05775 [Phycisphaerales bacterium]|nr:hypothetical protein [Phycisphaerales bacterium]
MEYGNSIHQQVEEQLGDDENMSQWFIKDKHVESMSPLCDLRASFEQRTGGLTTLERLTNQIGCSPSGFMCEDDLRADMISARTGLSRVTSEEETDVDHPDIKTPWDVLDYLPELLLYDLEQAEHLGNEFSTKTVGENKIDVHSSATIFPGVILDATLGPIRIEGNSVIRPNAVLCGPCWIGKNSTVVDSALIKQNTVLGPHCRVGGEVGGTVFQGYSNKSHGGHLGDSVVGEWVNFGAGTTNSNLLNTYADVIVTDLSGKRHRTGRQFVGCFVGDHVKFSICSRIMTGTLVGTGSMISTSSIVPSPTRRFAWITDSGERTYRVDKFIEVARTVMKRRDVHLNESSEAILRDLAEE